MASYAENVSIWWRHHVSVKRPQRSSIIIFTPWSFRPKGYCHYWCLSFHLSVSKKILLDNFLLIWGGITKYAPNMHLWIVSANIENGVTDLQSFTFKVLLTQNSEKWHLASLLCTYLGQPRVVHVPSCSCKTTDRHVFFFKLKVMSFCIYCTWVAPVKKLWIMWVRSWNCGCLVTWFCYQLIAKPGNKTAAVSWPDPCIIEKLQCDSLWLVDNTTWCTAGF